MPAINGGHRLSCSCAGRRSCRRGGALCWEWPSAARRASARRWTGWSVSRSEQRPGDRAGAHRSQTSPHTPCRCGGRASPTLVRHLCHILLSARMLPCTRPNYTHMTLICRCKHPSHHHTRTCPGVNGHVDTHGGRLSSPARGIWQPSLSSAAPRPSAPCSGWPPPEEV